MKSQLACQKKLYVDISQNLAGGCDAFADCATRSVAQAKFLKYYTKY